MDDKERSSLESTRSNDLGRIYTNIEERKKKYETYITDLSHLRTYMIDDRNSVELDDAISLEKGKDGFKVWIHIADAASYIDEDSEIDRIARDKGSTIYLANSVRTIFPKELIDNQLSLKAGRKALTLSCGVILDEYGDIMSSEITRAWIKPLYSLIYDEADELIDYAPPQEDDLYILNELLKRRRQYRKSNGAVFIEQPQGKFLIRDNIQIHKIIENTDSRRLVSEAMILMGTVIAEYGKDNNISLLYRHQPQSLLPSKNRLNQISLLPLRNSAIKQTLKKATISTRPQIHFTLGLQCYVQATSPLRRYTDLIVHRQILNYIGNKDTKNESELQQLITKVEIAQNQTQAIMKENILELQTSWFNKNIDKLWTIYYLRTLKLSESICLYYFNELEMEIVCKVQGISSANFGEMFKAKFVRKHDLDTQLEFILYNLG